MKKLDAYLKLKEGSVNQFLTHANIIIEKSNLEQECHEYRLFQEVGKPNCFVFCEKYTNQESIDYHLSTEHFKTFVSEITELLVEEPKIEIY